MTSSTGVQVTDEIPAPVETPGVDSPSVFGYALIGFLVGVVAVALGLIWLPALRGADPRSLAAFMALTAGLLTLLASRRFPKRSSLQATLPASFAALASSYSACAGKLPRADLGLPALQATARGRREPARRIALATLVTIGIGIHNLGEGLAIGSLVRAG